MGVACRSSAKSTLTHKSPALRGFFGRAKDYGILIVSCSHSSPVLYKETFFARDLFDCPRPARSHNTLLVGPEKNEAYMQGYNSAAPRVDARNNPVYCSPTIGIGAQPIILLFDQPGTF